MKERMYCYVGDLSGFRNIILNLEYIDLGKRVQEWKDFIKSGVERFDLPRYNLVSDTVFAGAESNERGLVKLIAFSRFMLEKGIEKSFPIRGAISLGDVSWDKDIPFGKPLVNAYELAVNQEWIGTSCDNGFYIPKRVWNFDILFAYPPPLKYSYRDGHLTMHPVVSWDVPPISKLIALVELKGLTKEGELWKWKLMNMVQNTTSFSLFLKLAKAGLIKQKGRHGKMLNAIPETFPAYTPMEPIEYYINFLLESAEDHGP